MVSFLKIKSENLYKNIKNLGNPKFSANVYKVGIQIYFSFTGNKRKKKKTDNFHRVQLFFHF